jgi:hypothetical protein
MQFNKLKIERMAYGEKRGQIIATLEIDGENVKMELQLGETAGHKILLACADIVAESAQAQAFAFRQEFLEAVGITSGTDFGNGKDWSTFGKPSEIPRL